jgi:hypothetical protein
MRRFLKLFGFTANGENGSARKLTAFAFVLFAAYLHLKHADTDPLSFLICDCCVVLISLGIVTAEQVIKLRNGQDNPAKDTDSAPVPN